MIARMKFYLVSKSTPSPKTLLVPVVNNDTLSDTLQQIAEYTQLPLSLIQNDFKAELGESLLLYHQGKHRMYLIGLGSQAGFNEVLRAFRSFCSKQNNKLDTSFGISFLFNQLTNDYLFWLDACVNGTVLGTYHPGIFKSSPPKHSLSSSDIEVGIFVADEFAKDAQIAIERGEKIAHTQIEIMHLVNAPSNKKNPEDLAAWAQASGKKHGFAVEVFGKEKAQEIGLHGLLAVNRGSEFPPAFIIMEYKPEGKEGLPKVGLVGKGVTFDTGGISIKPSTNMHFMKSDMGGAAAVLGTMEAAAKLQLPIHLIGIVPSTDNSVDALAIKPSDVIDSYSGKTIEIIDTDAEGRLILADGLFYMVRHFAPEVLIDLATLTGSAVRTFGYHAAALFSNADELSQQLRAAGEKVGERVWPLPIWDVYKEDLKSDVADVRNYSGRPLAGAIGAAKFLEVFIDNHPKWAHLDIAGVAFSDSEFTNQKSATAFGIRLLTTFLQSLTTENT